MKKVYTIIALMFLFVGAYSQIPMNHPLSGFGQVVKMGNPHHANSMKSIQPITIAYDTADNWTQTNMGNLYTHFYNVLNYNYVAGVDTFQEKYLVVAVDTLVDPYISGTGNTSYSYSTYPTLYLDSIYIGLQQANASGMNDTLIVKIMNVNGIGYPGSTLLTADTLIIAANNSISMQTAGVNSFTNAISNYGFAFQSFYFNQFLLTPNHSKFAIQVEYHGALIDTCGFIYGIPNVGPCASLIQFGIPEAIASTLPGGVGSSLHVAANSFNYQCYPGAGLDPPSTGTEYFFYDCNSDGTRDAGDGMELEQNWTMFIFLNGSTLTGVQENKTLGIKLNQNIPNPFNNTTDISYELANKSNNVTLEVTDITGRVVMSINKGAQDAGNYKVTIDSKNLSQGVYFYTLNVDGYRLTNKMIITR